MALPRGMTYLDQYGNFNLLRIVMMPNGMGHIQQTKSYPSACDLSSYGEKYYGSYGSRLLDQIYINAESPDILYSLYRTCVSFELADYSDSEFWQLLEAKHRFFESLLKRANTTGHLHVPSCYILHSDNLQFTLSDIVRVFNPCAIALHALPAYLVMDAYNFGQVGTSSESYGKFLQYRCIAPPMLTGVSVSIENLDDYLDAFWRGNFVYNDSDVFLTIYGLAGCIASLLHVICSLHVHREAKSIKEVVNSEEFNIAYELLSAMGALSDPFKANGAVSFIRQDGIANAQDANSDLYATLKLADEIRPFPMVPVSPAVVKAIFYGLINLFGATKSYFGISKDIRFEF